MILFFDDQNLEARKNFNRDYEIPEYISQSHYQDPSNYSMCGALPSVVYSDELQEYVMIFIFFSALSQCEHGNFRTEGYGAVVCHKIKRDRFIYLESEGYGNIRTRNLLI